MRLRSTLTREDLTEIIESGKGPEADWPVAVGEPGKPTFGKRSHWGHCKVDHCATFCAVDLHN